MAKDLSKLRIAIDGPAAAGKGTVAFALSKELDLDYINSGAFFRAVAYVINEEGLKIKKKNDSKICSLLKGYIFEIESSNDPEVRNKVYINGKEMTAKLYTPGIDKIVPLVSALPEVHSFVERRLKSLAERNGLVMEGRDAGTVFMPKADFKFFLTATLTERARRRFEEYKSEGLKITLGKVKEQIRERDRIDRERETSPLRVAKDARVVDTTEMTVEEVVDTLLEIIKGK